MEYENRLSMKGTRNQNSRRSNMEEVNEGKNKMKDA